MDMDGWTRGCQDDAEQASKHAFVFVVAVVVVAERIITTTIRN
jgi:hypothetical protein